MSKEPVKLDQGIHVMHLFYRVDRVTWKMESEGPTTGVRKALEELVAANPGPGHPRLSTYVNVGGKADLAFMLMHEDLVKLGELHRKLEACFPPAVLQPVYTYLSVTELPDYVSEMQRISGPFVV